MLGFMLHTSSSNIRIRQYSDDSGRTFLTEWVLTPAQWNSILAQVGTSTGGAQAGAASTEIQMTAKTPANVNNILELNAGGLSPNRPTT